MNTLVGLLLVATPFVLLGILVAVMIIVIGRAK